MAIDKSVTFFVDGRKRKLLKYNKKAREIIEIRCKVKETTNCHPETNF